MQNEITELRNQVRTLKRIVYGFGCLLVAGVVVGATSLNSIDKVTKSQQFKVLNNNGNTVVQMGFQSANGSGVLKIFDNSGNEIFSTITSTAPTSTAPSPGTQPVIESTIDGKFEGWNGDTIFKLLNGQIWQQTEYNYHYHYAYMPKVIIVQTGTGYKMQVDGVTKAIRVKRLK